MSLADKIFTRIERRKDGGEIIFPSFISSEDVALAVKQLKATLRLNIDDINEVSLPMAITLIDDIFGELK